MSNQVLYFILLFFIATFFIQINCQTKIVEFNGRKFQFNETKGNVDSHNSSCAGVGMQLALLKSQEELDFVVKNKTPELDALLGLVCSDPDDVASPFVWADGRSVTFGTWVTDNSCQATGGAVIRDNSMFSRVYSNADNYGAVCTEIGK